MLTISPIIGVVKCNVNDIDFKIRDQDWILIINFELKIILKNSTK